MRYGTWVQAALGVGLVCSGGVEAAEGGFNVPVAILRKAPVLDGGDADWRAEGVRWTRLPATHASTMNLPGEQGDASDGFSPRPEIMAGVFEDRFFLAVRWHDDKADTVYRRWVMQDGRYRRDQKLDDMLAVRFHTAGTFDECMLSGKAYTVDVWRWSAGRSQLAGIADDMQHVFSWERLDGASEYTVGDAIMYMRKTNDAGEAGWALAPLPSPGGPAILPGVMVGGQSRGSRADVKAQGVWREGIWTVEFERNLDTGDADDVRFVPGKSATGQVGFFNPGYRMQKQVSSALVFEIPPRKTDAR